MRVEWSGVEWSGVEWSGVEWSGVERLKSGGGRFEVLLVTHTPSPEKVVWEEEKRGGGSVCEKTKGWRGRGEERECRRRARKRNLCASG